MSRYRKGEFVQFDGMPAVVVGIDSDDDVPEEHVTLWFGEPKATRVSEGGSGSVQAEVWTVPEYYCEKGIEPKVNH